MQENVKRAVNAAIAKQREDFYNTHLKRIKTLKLHELLKRKNIFLLATLNQPPEQIITDAVKSFSVASMETVFGICLHKILEAILAAAYTTSMVSSGKTFDIEVHTPKARLTIELKSGGSTHNHTSYTATGTELEAARARMRLAGLPVVLIHATCYGKKRTEFNKPKWDVQGQTLWYIASGGDPDSYKKIVQMFTHQTKRFRRRLETVTNNTIERLTTEFKIQFCQHGVKINWGELAKVSCENLNLEDQAYIKEQIIG